MFLMMAEVLSLGRVSRENPGNGFWSFLALQQSHVEWVGCTLHDLIQPSFSFLVGVALPFSLAGRIARGDSFRRLFGHAIWRSFLLIALGIFLRSIGKKETNFTFEDTLTQIGLGYTFLFLIGQKSLRFQWGAVAVILAGYWAAFALYPLPGPGFDWAAAGTDPNWPQNLKGFSAHWNKNTNFAWAFDQWFMNLFPREKPFVFNGGGYSTLSFVPTLGTMILGSIAGAILRLESPPTQKMKHFLTIGFSLILGSFFLHWTGLCPIVKKIWTPAWTLFSGGCAFLILKALYVLVDVKGSKRWGFVFLVIGMNSIAAYCMDWLFLGFLRGGLRTHFGDKIFEIFGPSYASLLQGICLLTLLWLMLYWMYRRRIFLKI